MPFEGETTEASDARQILSGDGGPLQRSLFAPLYESEFNRAEREVAVYLDGEETLTWWHRNVARTQYGIQGWRRDRIYPDFIFAVRADGAGRIVVLETKGDHLDNPEDTKYKREVLSCLSSSFAWDDCTPAGELELVVNDGVTVQCALILMSEWKTKLPQFLRAGFSLRHFDGAPFMAGQTPETLGRAEVAAGPVGRSHRGCARPEGTRTRTDDLRKLGRPRSRPGRQPAAQDHRSRPARDLARRECHPGKGRGGDQGTGRSQRLPSPPCRDEGSAPIGPPWRNDRRLLLFGVAFEPLRRRRDLTACGHGPLTIQECPCGHRGRCAREARSDVTHCRSRNLLASLRLCRSRRGGGDAWALAPGPSVLCRKALEPRCAARE